MKKKTKRPNLVGWSLLSAFLVLLCVVCLVLNLVSKDIAVIMSVLTKADTYEVIEGNSEEDDVYFASAFSSEEELIAFENALCAAVEAEGAVLLMNENDALPLSSGNRVSLFARGSVDLMYGGTGSGNVDTSSAPNLKDALNEVGIEVNESLFDWYSSKEISEQYSRITPGRISDKLMANTEYCVNEAPWALVDENNCDSFEAYGDAAIVVISRSGGEGADLPAGDIGSGTDYTSSIEGDGNYLALSAEEKDLLAGLSQYKQQGVFEKIVVLINTSNAIELDFLNESLCGADYGVDAVMWIGDVGQNGILGVAQLLAGELSPSGSLVDTYLYDNLANPAVINFYSQNYDNVEEYGLIVEDGYDLQGRYTVYQEGIYLGYRYFETRYEDVVMQSGNAGDYDYSSVVAYPFGYGESYTEFELSDFEVHETEDAFEISVTVTNIGDFESKKTVQVYLQSPYTDYDRRSGIEKASVELCGFAKTELLSPSESQRVFISVDKSELRSYDASIAKTYILDAGDYYLSVGNGAHEALNNILAAKGYTPENTNGRMDEAGNSALTWKWTNDTLDTEIFSVSETGTVISNLFDEADPNKSSVSPGSVTWLSRSDWSNTFPVSNDYGFLVNDALNEALALTRYDASSVPVTEMPTMNADNGLSLIDLKGKSYDDPLWEELLDQLSFEDMAETISMGFHNTYAVESVDKPATNDENGPQGLTATLMFGTSAMCYPSEDVLAATFNLELIQKIGECIGEDCLSAGYSGLYGPGVNLHRSAYSGRNFEYYSEDPFLSGAMAASEVQGIQSKGVYVYMKHVALNDFETSRCGVSVWVNEQTLREIYLEPVERAVVDGDALGVMSAFNRIGAKWAGSCEELLTGFLREECGMEGIVITDMSALAKYMDIADGVIAGNNLWDNSIGFIQRHSALSYKNDAYIVSMMRESMHRILYTVANSNAMNGISSGDEIRAVMPSWQKALIGVNVVLAVLAALSIWKLSRNIKKRKQLKTLQAE